MSPKTRLTCLCLASVILACSGRVADRSSGSSDDLQVTTPDDFARLVQSLSERGGYFDTDNLISNESSYLHVIGKMREMNITGGAYIGVGPGQSFSYIAQTRPEIAFIIDIRRDNLLQHLWFKALFELADNRVEFLAMLLGVSAPDDADEWGSRSLPEIVEYFGGLAKDDGAAARSRQILERHMGDFGVPLDAEDFRTVRRFQDTFSAAGLDLQFNTFNRAPLPSYPTFRRLLLETDLSGRLANYLAREEEYQFVKTLQETDLLIPVVGDLSGDHALRSIGQYLREIGVRVSVLYTSNVEFYVMQDGRFPQYAENVSSLPRDDKSVIVRSYFGGRYRYAHPEAVPGYSSVQLLQTLSSFADDFAAGAYRSYWDLVTKRFVPLR